MAVLFNGTNQGLYRAALSANVGFPFSVACLFKGPASPANDYLWEVQDGGSHKSSAFLDQAGRWVRMYHADGGSGIITSDTAGYTANTWTLCVVTVSSGGVCKLYRNTTATTAGTNRSPTGMNQLLIGRDGAAANFLPGEVAEFAIWNGTELSAANVSALYNGGTFKKPTGIGVNPTWYWSLDNTLSDTGSGSYSDTLTNLNSATYSTHPTMYAGDAEITVLGNGVEILDGDTTPSTTDHTDFGTMDITETRDRTFTVRNDGDAVLTISSVSVSPTTYFSILSGVGDTTLDPAQTVTFTVRFDPAVGESTATVTILSDDASEATYTFNVRGAGVDVGQQGDWRPTYPQPWRENDLMVGV